jgi:DNA repair protein RecN (Recombination protein N)
MLQHLSISNYATVEALEIEFAPGMSVITGETGAGKSIILGALGLTLGDRADKTVIRPGASKVDISAEFDTRRIRSASDWLSEQELSNEDDPGLCILRRVVGSDGRSRAFINGANVTLANLKTLGEMLLDIHSQHEHQSLLRRSTHQRLLDEYAVQEKLLAKLHSTFKQWQQNHRQLEDLQASSEESSAESQLLAYQLSELEEMEIGDDEIAALEAEFKTLSSADETLASVSAALNACREDENGNAASQIHHALTALRELPDSHKAIAGIIELLETAAIQLDEAVTELNAFNDRFEADPERLEQVNERLSALHKLARKHRIKPEELPQLIADLRDQLARFENSDAELDKLRENDRLLQEQFRQLARDVSQQRQQGASKLAKAVNKQLHDLGMPHASLSVDLQTVDSDLPTAQGLETVEFLVCTNPGQAPGGLAKIASGGELSRISLAIQVITAQTSQVPSLVFDEVDVGIGGGVARVVGELLRKLGERTQILCVTHQAQVAGQAHHHFFVSKHTRGKQTLTRITSLSGDEVVREVARMLGGEEFSAESLAHAEKMVVAEKA